jgi:hypothetical protein
MCSILHEARKTAYLPFHECADGLYKMFKTLVLSFGIAGLVAAILAMTSDRRGFEELAVRAAIADQASAHGSKCPLSVQYTDSAELGLLSVCLKYGLGAYEAARRYPEAAAKVFGVYGEEDAFQGVLARYGHPVIPVIAYFAENGSREFQVRQALGDALQQMWTGHKPKWAAEITREQIGLLAIHSLNERGNEMLSEFEIVDGKAKRKPMTRFFLGLKEVFFGGVADIETILVRGERLPSWKEAGFATLDVTIVSGVVGAVSKVARLGIGTAEAAGKSSIRLAAEGATKKSTIRLAAEGAYEAISGVGKVGVLVGPAAFVYVAVTRPQLIASAGGWLTERFGGNRLVGIFAVYLVGILLALQLLRPLLWCGRIVGRAAFRLVHHTQNRQRYA